MNTCLTHTIALLLLIFWTSGAIVAEYLEDLNGPKLAPSKHSSPTRSKKNRLEVPPKNSKVKFGDPDLEEESKLSESSSVRAGGSRAIAA